MTTTPNVEALKSCPFCGGRAEIKPGQYTTYVMCLGCEVMSANLESHAELVAAWNTRAEPQGMTPDEIAEAQQDDYISSAGISYNKFFGGEQP